MSYISQLFYEISAMIMSILMSLGAITVPATDDLLECIYPETEVNFVLTGDTQLSNYMPSRESALVSLSQDIANSDVDLDAFVVVGDVAENGFADEYARVTESLTTFSAKNYIMVAGNHDIRMRDYEQSKARFLDFMNNLNDEENAQTALNYKLDINGYTFLVMGSDSGEFEKAFISDAQLQWLNIELKKATKEDKPVFVLCHYPLAESHGLPGTWGSSSSDDVTGTLPTYEYKDKYDYTGSIGSQSNEIYNVISRYENVIFVTGHLHTGFGKYSYQVINEENNVIGINVPSVGIENKDGGYNNAGIGYFVEVTSDAVYFRARDFANGKNLTDYDITVDIQK